MSIKKPNTNMKIKKKVKMNKKKEFIIAQELRYTRLLANSTKKVTNQILKNLQKWLFMRSQNNYDFSEADFLRLWKGLFYAMWMSDKPLVQEEISDSISKLVHSFTTRSTIILYTKSTLKCLSSHWFGLDKYRVDKFEMLLRRIIRQTFVVLKKETWDLDYVKDFAKVVEELFMDSSTALGVILQINEVFMEELSKISEGNIPTDVVTELIRPFVIYMVSRSDCREIHTVIKNIFQYLIFQSDVGLDYQEKFQAWKAAGFPCQSIKEIEKVELSDDENSDDEKNMEEEEFNNNKEVHLDPRAGKVDVELPQIPFDAQQIINLLTEYKFLDSSTTKARKQVGLLINQFELLSKGNMPLGIKKVTVPKKRKSGTLSKRAAEKLLDFESKLYSDSCKNRRKRKVSGSVDLKDETKNVESEEVENEIKSSLKKCKKQKLENSESKNTLVDENSAKKLKLRNKSKKCNDINLPKKKKIGKKIPRKNLVINPFVDKDVIKKCSNNITNAMEFKEVDQVKRHIKKVKSMKPVGKEVKEVGTVERNIKQVKSMKPVVERLDVSHTDFIKKILQKVETEKSKVPTGKSPKKSLKKNGHQLLSTPLKNTNGQINLVNSLSENSKKKVKIMLQKNTEQHTSEYLRQLKKSPAIPYDANRKPSVGVLKASPIPSPINPFYKRCSF